MSQTIHPINTIVSDPAIRGGRPIIAGTTLKVADVVVVHVLHQKTPDEVASWFRIPLADVYAALAYYYANRAAIDEDIREQDRLAREFKAQRIGSRHDPLL